MTKLTFALILLLSALTSCRKNGDYQGLRYYLVGIKHVPADWRDSAFIVATANTQLISAIEAQLKLPVAERKIVAGALAPGSGGYNRNASHEFKWHMKENDWNLVDAAIEIYDGRPYNDVDSDTTYWLHTMTRFAPWHSYIMKEITKK